MHIGNIILVGFEILDTLLSLKYRLLWSSDELLETKSPPTVSGPTVTLDPGWGRRSIISGVRDDLQDRVIMWSGLGLDQNPRWSVRYQGVYSKYRSKYWPV